MSLISLHNITGSRVLDSGFYKTAQFEQTARNVGLSSGKVAPVLSWMLRLRKLAGPSGLYLAH
jgi:hypothetical protein